MAVAGDGKQRQATANRAEQSEVCARRSEEKDEELLLCPRTRIGQHGTESATTGGDRYQRPIYRESGHHLVTGPVACVGDTG
jgi:hypothetical protein